MNKLVMSIAFVAFGISFWTLDASACDDTKPHAYVKTEGSQGRSTLSVDGKKYRGSTQSTGSKSSVTKYREQSGKVYLTCRSTGGKEVCK